MTGGRSSPGLDTSRRSSKNQISVSRPYLVVAVGDSVDQRFLPSEIGVLGDVLEVEAYESLGSSDLVPGQFRDFVYGRGERRVGAPDLRHVAAAPVLDLRSRDPEHAKPGAGMPTQCRALGEEQESSVGDSPVTGGPLDQAVVLECLQDGTASDRRVFQEGLGEPQIQVVQRCLRPEALLVPDAAICLLALVDDLLRLADDPASDPVRESIAADHDGFGGYGDLECEDLVAPEREPLGAAGYFG